MWYLQCKDEVICSISGWRAICEFEDRPKHDNPVLICLYFAIRAFIEAQQEAHSGKTLTVALGSDTRISGIVLLELAKYCLENTGCRHINLGVIPGPAIMAYTAAHSDAFIYFTASHNPKEYNGIKFGSSSGKVLDQTEYQHMLRKFEIYKYQTYSPENFKAVLDKCNLHNTSFSEITIDTGAYDLALETYKERIYQSVFTQLKNPYQEFICKIKDYNLNTKKKIGVLIDPNGGARTWGGDILILEELGIHCEMINTEPSIYAHAIIPEGESLSQARDKLVELNSEQDAIFYPLAIVCDCDGDRGNIVFYDSHSQELRSLEAQEVFASILEVELAWNRFMHRDTHTSKKSAVVVNGPSSLRCEAIASTYSASVYRAEVGEANVVSLGEKIAQKHKLILVGEASNGGVIMFPSKVRDPLCTLCSYLKSILWAEKLGLNKSILENIARHPPFVTSTTEDKTAKYTIPKMPYKEMMARILNNFDTHFNRFQELFHRHTLMVEKYRYFNFSSTNTIELSRKEIWSEVHSGGLAIYFYSKNTDEPIAFIWLRPSGTEPLVRLLVDISKGNLELLTELQHLWIHYLDEVIQ